MAGQIISRGPNTWLVRVSRGRDPKTGKRRYHNKTVRGTKKDAQKYLTKVMREIDTGKYIEPNTVTLDAYLDRWLEVAAKPRLRASTFQDYEYVLKKYVRPHIGQRRLDQLTPLDVQGAISELQASGLSARTIRYAHMVLNSALKQAVKWRMINTNPAEHVEKPKYHRKEMTVLTPEEVERFLDAAGGDRWGIVFIFAIATGMRPSEILGLQWKDVDLKAGTVRVQRALTRKKGGRHLTPPKTQRSRRTIPLPASMVGQLREHKAEQNRERLAAGEAYDNQDFVFAGPKGQPLSDRTLSDHHLRPILKAAGLPTSVRFYDLRHTCATLLLLANEHPKIVSERLGHSTITLTMDTYSHVLPTMQQAAADKLEGLLFRKEARGG